LAGFSSTTRVISIWPSAVVMPDTSEVSALAEKGCAICHSAPSFFSTVASPAADVTLISATLSAS
jgi:hypothetical protein